MKYLPVVLGFIIGCSKVIPSPPPVETTGEKLPPLPAASSTRVVRMCAEGMVYVEGNYCSEVEQKCLRWLDKDTSPEANFGIGPLQCAEFAKPAKCKGNREHMRFCIDTYEWPNKAGSLPPVGIDWYTAQKSCQNIGKRLCTAKEWTFACEGEDVKPYPYGDGYHRDDTACNIDQPSMDPSIPRSEWPKHYRGVASGSMARCVSSFGVHDMTGNVDEWVNNVGGRKDGDPYFSGLKGGYWGPVRTRCRPMTTAHSPQHSFYQNGFRCCDDAAPILHNEL